MSTLKKAWDNLVSAGLKRGDVSTESYQRIKSISIYNLAGMLMLLGHGIYNFILGNSVTGIVESSLLLILLASMVHLRFTGKIGFLSIVLLCGGIVLVGTLLVTGGVDKTGILWIYFYPLIAFSLKGKRSGFLWILAYLLSLSVIVLLRSLKVIEIPYSFTMIRQALFSFLVIFLFAYLYEDIKEKNEKRIKDLVFVDSLTGLPNRYSLLKDIKSIRKFQLLLIDIDDFKTINNYV